MTPSLSSWRLWQRKRSLWTSSKNFITVLSSIPARIVKFFIIWRGDSLAKTSLITELINVIFTQAYRQKLLILPTRYTPVRLQMQQGKHLPQSFRSVSAAVILVLVLFISHLRTGQKRITH